MERIFEHSIPQQIKVDNMQFRFMKSKVTTAAIFGRPFIQEELSSC